jgi:hypothetical protein
VDLAITASSVTKIGVDSREAGASGPLLTVTATTTPTTTASSTTTTGAPTTTSSTTTTTTAPPPSDPRIAAAGDIACASSSVGTSSCHQAATSNLLVNGGFTGVLTLGDNQYEAGALSAYTTFYDPTWGRAKATTFPAPGNHEYVTSGAAGYFGYYGTRAGPSGRGYYSFNLGTWHLISLNSEISMAPGSAQEQWLKNDLATSSATCTLAYWHRPLFSSGSGHGNNPDTKPLWDDLYTAGADVVLGGHDHDYERFAPQTPAGVAAAGGIREFVVGTGGRSHYAVGTVKTNSQVRNNDTFGVLQLTLHNGSYDWKFLPEAGSSFTDSGSTACH